jgi:hypothetical protein
MSCETKYDLLRSMTLTDGTDVVTDLLPLPASWTDGVLLCVRCREQLCGPSSRLSCSRGTASLLSFGKVGRSMEVTRYRTIQDETCTNFYFDVSLLLVIQWHLDHVSTTFKLVLLKLF